MSGIIIIAEVRDDVMRDLCEGVLGIDDPRLCPDAHHENDNAAVNVRR